MRSVRARRSTAVAVGGIVLLLAWTSCADGTTATEPTPLGPATLHPGDPLPLAEDPVLVVEGGGMNGTVALDLATIEAVGAYEVRVHEPFVDADLTFEGVWMTDFLALLDPGGASTVSMHALDDYVIEFSLDDLEAGDAFLATRRDGEPLSIEDGGPIRLVFVDDDGIGSNADLWIWNIDGFAFS